MKKKLFSTIVCFVVAFMLTFAFAACQPTTPTSSTGSGSGGGTIDDLYIASIEVTKNPTKMRYCAIEEFNPTGMEISVIWSDGFVMEVTTGECTFSAIQNGKVTISYDEASYDFPIEVGCDTVEQVSAKAATCADDGWSAHYACVNCKTAYTDATGATPCEKPIIPATGNHNLGPVATEYSPQICLDCNRIMVQAGISFGKVQVEDTENVSFYHADGTSFNPIMEQKDKSKNNFGAEGYQSAGNMDGNAINGNVQGATIHIKVTVEEAGEYALSMRTQSTESTGHGSLTVDLSTIYSGVSVNGGAGQAVTGTVLPSTLTTGWVNMNRWTIVTLGTYELKAGENEVVLTSKATRIPDIDWVKFTPKASASNARPEAQFISLVQLDRNNSFNFAKTYNWAACNDLYIRIGLDTATFGADFYDIPVSKDDLVNAGFELTTAGTQTHDVTIDAGAYGTRTLSLTLVIE